jgi:NAD(P) transhydrogenase subunit alpha
MSVPVEAEGEGGYAKQLDEEIYRMERDAIRDHVAGADVVISTALVPGAAAPMLIDEAMVRAMKPGSVIVDLAAEAGGNCELTVPGQAVTTCGVSILGPTNLASEVPVHASQMYARNVLTVLKYLVKDGKLEIDSEDEIVRGACFLPAAAASEATGGM